MHHEGCIVAPFVARSMGAICSVDGCFKGISGQLKAQPVAPSSPASSASSDESSRRLRACNLVEGPRVSDVDSVADRVVALRPASASLDTQASAVPRRSIAVTVKDKLAMATKKLNLKGKPARNLVRNSRILYEMWSGGNFEDEFTKREVIGEGGFGQVFVAQSRADGAKRAVKTMQKSSNKEIHAMQLNEVQTLVNLDHPHIVKLFRYYETDTDIKLVFELCKGSDLLERIINGPMSERDSAVALRHMLKALNYCHSKYIGHYDVKPENFMYSGLTGTNLKMIDLGFSGTFQGNGKVRGTVSYMAPEVVHGSLGPEADVWCCGAVLFAMLTTLEFTSLDPGGDNEVVMKVLKVRFQDRRWAQQRLQEAVSGLSLSTHACDLLAKLLVHDRHMRPSVPEALVHPFITPTYTIPIHDEEIEKQAKAVLKGLVDSLRSFAKQPLLKRSAILVMSHVVSCGDGLCKAQRVAYRKLDRNGSGDLSPDSLEAALRFNQIEVPSDLDELFTYIDIDKDGYICFVDYLAPTLPAAILLDKSRCATVFNVMDINKDGLVDAMDLARAFNYDEDDDVAMALCSEAISEAGLRPEGFSAEQFIALMRREQR